MKNGKPTRSNNSKRRSGVPAQAKKGGNATKRERKSMETTTYDGSPRHNDPNWYFLDSNIADQASAISFASYLGVPTEVKMHTSDDGDSKIYAGKVSMPSIMEIKCNPCPGITNDTKSGINIAALKLYSDLSAMNAKTTNYAPQDLTMLLLALGEIISVMEHIRRAFGVAFTYSVRNRDLPVKLLQAMGFDKSFLTSLADHRLQFNSLITAINKIPFVSNVAYFYKCADMYQRVYLDSDSPMAQVMVMRPFSTWVLVEDEIDTGSYLDTVVLPQAFEESSESTFGAWMDIAQSMIDALFNSATFNYIYSDIINYASKTGASLLYLDYLLEGYTVVPEYNPNFSMQLHNANICGHPVYDGDESTPIGEFASGHTAWNNVYPDVDKNKVTYRPMFRRKGVLEGSFMDMPTPTPTTADKVEASRYVCTFEHIGTFYNDPEYVHLFEPYAFPDHYITQIRVIGQESGNVVNDLIHTNGTLSQKADLIDACTALYPFRSAPMLMTYSSLDLDRDDLKPRMLSEFNYFTYIPKEWFKRVNDLAFQALFTLR